MISYRAALTLPPKDRPYTQEDMDIVIGHPVSLNISVNDEAPMTPMVGTIVSAEIQDDGSALVTMDVSVRPLR